MITWCLAAWATGYKRFEELSMALQIFSMDFAVDSKEGSLKLSTETVEAEGSEYRFVSCRLRSRAISRNLAMVSGSRASRASCSTGAIFFEEMSMTESVRFSRISLANARISCDFAMISFLSTERRSASTRSRRPPNGGSTTRA